MMDGAGNGYFYEPTIISDVRTATTPHHHAAAPPQPLRLRRTHACRRRRSCGRGGRQVAEGVRIVDEEQFGPVLPIIKVRPPAGPHHPAQPATRPPSLRETAH
eukprot:SAG11_NODE_846_length_6884_cov_5.651732_9_plen_103_part_00